MTLEEAVECLTNPNVHEMILPPNQLTEWLTELKEAKRLLKAALADMNNGGCNSNCYKCKHCGACDYSERFTWKLTDEAEKLIGGSGNG